MDNKTLVLLSKFAVSSRKVIGSVNPAKLMNDSEYSAGIFQKVAEFGDEELVILSLEVQAMLGLMVATTVTAKNTATIHSIKPVKVDEEKYIFGARG